LDRERELAGSIDIDSPCVNNLEAELAESDSVTILLIQLEARMSFKLFAGAVLVMATIGTAPASASVYNAVSDFSVGNGNPNGPWAYGSGVGGVSFNRFASSFTSTTGNLGPSSYWQATVPVDNVPLVGLNVSGSPYNFGTVMVPTGALWVHPGPVNDVIVQWTAPAAGTYSLSASFALMDISPSGVIGEVFDNGSLIYSGTLTGPGADQSTHTLGQSETFSDVVSLAAKDTLSFVVNQDGSFLNDSTALTANISSVPEASTWLMLILGFFGVGFRAIRRSTPALA
jgi:hypothetical protein